MFSISADVTDKADILEQVRKDPYRPLHGQHGHAIQYQPDDGQDDESSNEDETPDGEVPDAYTEFDGPEGEHDPREDDDDHGDSAEDGVKGRTLVEPCVVGRLVDRLLWG